MFTALFNTKHTIQNIEDVQTYMIIFCRSMAFHLFLNDINYDL